MNSSCDICVIGSGAIGKAGALALAQAGLEVVLVAPQSLQPASSARPSQLWDQRVYALNHVAKHVLTSLKVWDAMDQVRVAPVDAIAVRGDATERPGRLNFDAYGARVGALAWIVEDYNLNSALDAALRFASGVKTVHGSATALHFTASAAQITLDSEESIQASLVVGADGANSWVRSKAGIGIDYRAYQQQGVVANFETEYPHHGVAAQWFLGEDGIVALLPLPGHRVSLVWSAPQAMATHLLNVPADQLAQRLMDLPGQTLGQMRMLPPQRANAFPLRLIRSQSMIADRVALIGDAAHVVHPLAGQGMNLGFADIDALVRALGRRDQHNDCGDIRTLARYARDRKEDVLLMQVATDGLQRLFSSEFQPVKVLRNFGMDVVDKLPFLKRRFMKRALGASLSLTTDFSR